jgi:Sigma-70, region 4
MPSRSSASAFDRLAPDQRAAVELVLRQGRSYGELADMLGMPEDTIRARARNGVTGLAPDLLPPSRAGEIADWLLGQQSEAHGARTRALLLGDPGAARWAATVAEALRAAPGGESVPALPSAPDEPASRVNGSSPHEVGEAATPRADAAAADGGEPPSGGADEAAASSGGSSRLGGALLIGAAVILVAAVLVFVFTRGDDDPDPSAEAPVATATATATPAASANDILLKGPAGSKAVGLMRLFQANDGTVRFAIAAQGVTPNAAGETYSLWFRKSDGAAQLLGDVKDPVGEKGELTSAGPSNGDVDKFPQWFATYDTILVTLDAKNAKEPGKVILSGDLPRSSTG